MLYTPAKAMCGHTKTLPLSRPLGLFRWFGTRRCGRNFFNYDDVFIDLPVIWAELDNSSVRQGQVTVKDLLLFSNG